MSNLQHSIDQAVNTFKSTLAQIYHEHILSVFGDIDGGGATNGHRVSNGNGRSNKSSNGLSKGAKRDPADIDALQVKFVAFVTKNPGLRIEQINKQLGTATKEMMLPIRKAISDGVVKVKGEKRATTYFPK